MHFTASISGYTDDIIIVDIKYFIKERNIIMKLFAINIVFGIITAALILINALIFFSDFSYMPRDGIITVVIDGFFIAIVCGYNIKNILKAPLSMKGIILKIFLPLLLPISILILCSSVMGIVERTPLNAIPR